GAGGTLSGTLTATAAAGLVAFSGLILTEATATTLQVSSSGLATATTDVIRVTAAPATHLVVTAQPPASVTAGASFGLPVAAEADLGNVDPSVVGNVALTLAGAGTGSPARSPSLGGILTQAAVGGVAAFSGLRLDQIAAGLTIQVSTASLTGTTTNPVT